MKKTKDRIIFDIISWAVLIFLSAVCFLPFLLLISASFSSNEAILQSGFSLLPKEPTLEAYKTAFKVPKQIFNAYKMSILVTAAGTFFVLLICSMTGYVLSRKDFYYRNKISFFFFFPTIFGGGLVPFYILCVQFLHFKQHPYMALILPGVFVYFYVIIFRSFMSNIPDSISESAKIDGANDFTIYLKLILPMAKPALATIGLFAALGYWNDWFNAMLYVDYEEFYPLQYFLYKTLNSMNAIRNVSSATAMPVIDLPTETFKYAVTMITIGPIILLYPFLQKYFIKGIAIGAVKG